MGGTVEAPSDVILRSPQLEPRSLSPEVLELVALPRILREDVQNGIEVVEDHPAVRPLSVGPAGKQVLLVLEPQPHLIDDRLRLALVAGGADRQVVGVGDELAHVEDDDVLRPFRVRERRQAPGEITRVGDAAHEYTPFSSMKRATDSGTR